MAISVQRQVNIQETVQSLLQPPQLPPPPPLPPPQPANHPNPLKRLLLSPRFATHYAILATIFATISYTTFIATGGTGTTTSDLFEATCVGTFLAILHTTLLLHAPTLRNHPMIQTRTRILTNPFPLPTILALSFMSLCLNKHRLGYDEMNIGSLVSGSTFILDVFLILLCVQPGVKGFGFIQPPIQGFLMAGGIMCINEAIGLVCFYVLSLSSFLLMVVQIWLDYD